ncbi:MAG: hypothetical protein PHS79_00355 [Patescibacteria group bacterium]|nr:hypothetical protein [Patescibacteria group bacterium]
MRRSKKKKKFLKILNHPIFVLSLLVVISLPFMYAMMDRKIKTSAISQTCKAIKISSTSFIRTDHLRDKTTAYGVLPTKDGGYVLTGETVMSNAMANPTPFIIKTDAKGIALWSRQFGSTNARGTESEVGQLAVETTDGGYVMAGKMTGFIDSKYEESREGYGDILVTKLSSKGTKLWSVMVGDYGTDNTQKLWALPNGDILLLAQFMQTGHGNDIADTSTITKYSVFIKFDKNGKVLMAKKMGWDALDAQRLADGSFIVLANIKVVTAAQPENILGPEVVPHDLPTIVRLDSDYKTTWAKSLEMIPSELNTVGNIASDGKITMGKTKIRLAGGDFQAIQQTSDGGFIAFGFSNLLLTQGMNGSIGQITQFTPRAFVAVKVDAAGNYQWTRKLTGNLSSGITTTDFHVAKTVDNEFVIMHDVIRDSTNLQAKWDDAVGANASPEAQKALTDALATNIELIKVDADFNPRWVKKIDLERDLMGYGIQPTTDKGVVVTGKMSTIKQHMVMMSLEPYEEAPVIKVDVNGGMNGSVAVSNHSTATLEDQSSYLVMHDMDAGVSTDINLNINKKVDEKVTAAKNVERYITKYSKISVKQICSYINADISTGGSGAIPAAKTWAFINYENAMDGSIDSDKNRQINDELLPILKKVFNDQVKMTDSMKSMWLTYYFPRLVTRADVEMVQKYYEGLGYKTDESHDGILYVSRVGLTLHMTFSVQSPMVGKLEVLF